MIRQSEYIRAATHRQLRAAPVIVHWFRRVYNASTDPRTLMLLPDPLPTDPDELDALYEKFISQDGYNQDDFERLMEARLRAWGMDPNNMTTAELLGAMQESMNRMLLNLHMAIGVVPCTKNPRSS